MLAEVNQLIVDAEDDGNGNVMVAGVVLPCDVFDVLFTWLPDDGRQVAAGHATASKVTLKSVSNPE